MAQNVNTFVEKNVISTCVLRATAKDFEAPISAKNLNQKRYRSYAALLGRDDDNQVTKHYYSTTPDSLVDRAPAVGDAYEVAVFDSKKGYPIHTKCIVIMGVQSGSVEVAWCKGPATAQKLGAMLRGSAHTQVQVFQAVQMAA